MDLVASGSRVIVTMQHSDKKGDFKLVEKCTLPETGLKCVDTVVTNMAVFKMINGELTLTDIASEFCLEEVKELTGFNFKTVPVD